MSTSFRGRTRLRRVLAIAAAVATSAAVSAGVAPAAFAAPAPHPFAHSKPTWLGKAHRVASVKSSADVSFGLLLNLRNEAAAQAEVQRLSDPTSADYGKWLTNAQFAAQYAPTAADVAGVSTWLKSQGFTVTTTLKSGLYIGAKGSAAQVEKTFGTSLATYKYQGAQVRANATTLSLPASAPAAVVSTVSGVVGLDQGSALKKPADTTPPPAEGSRYGVYTQPCSSYYGQKTAFSKPAAYGKKQPYVVCGYTPKQLESAYGVSSALKKGIDGRGVTIAITDAYASPTIYGDAQKYNRFYGLPSFKPGQFSQVLPGSDDYTNVDLCGGSGWYGEETLDVEAVHTMAPGAKIVYVGGTDCVTGLDLAWAETIDSHRADIVTNSWGDGVDTVADLGASYIEFYEIFSLEAALTGITVNFSSGDDGDQTAGGTDLATKSLSFPSDLPLVTSVGGTTLYVGSKGQRLAEYGWQSAYSGLSGNTWTPTPPGTYAAGGGGGTSQLFEQPFYQRGVVPYSVAHYYGATAMRATPDISIDADSNSGLIVGQTQSFPNGTYWDRYRIGGTSLSSPLEAGVLALAEQRSHCVYGFVNPLYYHLLGTPALHDIVAPRHPQAEVRTDFANFLDRSDGLLTRLQTVDVQTTTLHDTPGWDDETGVGTPNGLAFVFGLGRH